MHDAEWIWRREFRAGRANIKGIAFVFVHILNGFVRMLGTDHQCGIRRISDLISHGNAGVIRKIVEKSLNGAIDARFSVSFKFDREGSVDREYADSQSHA